MFYLSHCRFWSGAQVPVQRPPGTGKVSIAGGGLPILCYHSHAHLPIQSYTGVELLRVLIQNKVKPILMIAFTNHALDHMLLSVLDADITKKVVRLGSRSNVEKVSSVSLEELEKLHERSRFSPAMGKEIGTIKDTEKEMQDLMKRINRRHIGWTEISSFLEFEYLAHFAWLVNPPNWIQELYQLQVEENEEWEEVGSGPSQTISSIYDFWLAGKDLEFLEPPKVTMITPAQIPEAPAVSVNRFDVLRQVEGDDQDGPNEEVEEDSDIDSESYEDILDDPALGWILLSPVPDASDETPGPSPPTTPILSSKQDTLAEEPAKEPVVDPSTSESRPNRHPHPLLRDVVPVPTIPTTTRTLQELQESSSVWNFSKVERLTISGFWTQEARMQAYRIEQMDFERLRKRHLDAQRRYNELKDEVSSFWHFCHHQYP